MHCVFQLIPDAPSFFHLPSPRTHLPGLGPVDGSRVLNIPTPTLVLVIAHRFNRTYCVIGFAMSHYPSSVRTRIGGHDGASALLVTSSPYSSMALSLFLNSSVPFIDLDAHTRSQACSSWLPVVVIPRRTYHKCRNTHTTMNANMNAKMTFVYGDRAGTRPPGRGLREKVRLRMCSLTKNKDSRARAASALPVFCTRTDAHPRNQRPCAIKDTNSPNAHLNNAHRKDVVMEHGKTAVRPPHQAPSFEFWSSRR